MMDARNREWQSRKWCIAVADSALNGGIERCHTWIGAYYTALIYRIARFQVKVYRSGTQSNEDAVSEVKSRFVKMHH